MSAVDAEQRRRGSDEPVPDMNVRIERTTLAWIARLIVFAWCLIPARGDVLEDWAGLYLRALKAENTPPPLGSRNTALFAVAVADAVNAIGHQWKPFVFVTNADEVADPQAAVAAAAYRIGTAVFPSRRAEFDALWQQTGADSASDPARVAGFKIGRASAEALLEARSTDGANTQQPYIPSDRLGAWRRTMPFFRPPELTHWRHVRPFALDRPSQFRPLGPGSPDSGRVLEDYRTTFSLGGKSSRDRTPDQTQAAYVRSDFSGTVAPPGPWVQITLALAASNRLDLPDKVRLFALVQVASADAAIACWDAKYSYNSWRPVTAINALKIGASSDGSETTWEPLLPTPAHPEYVSGHSTFSGAAAEVLRRWFGRDDLAFDVESDTVPGVRRHFPTLTAAAREIGMSRIWGGIHFRSADHDGAELGRQVGAWVSRTCFVPVAKAGEPIAVPGVPKNTR